MAQVVLRVAGAVVGGIYGGPQGAQAGWMLGGAIADAISPQQAGEPQTSSGPRLRDMSSGTSSYGAVIPILMGHPRVAGNMIWSSGKKEHVHTVTTGGGGGGGKGGGPPPEPSTTTTTYTYTIDMMFLLRIVLDQSPASVARVWANNKVIGTAQDGFAGAPWGNLLVNGGSQYQVPFSTYQAAVGIANAPAYRGRTTIMIEDLDLGEQGQIPNLQFELLTAIDGWD